MRVGIIGPSEDEVIPFIEQIQNKIEHNIAMLKFYSGKFNNIDVVALYCGVCKVNAAIATQILIDKFNVNNIIIIGVAGGINNNLNIGDTVISTEVAYHDVDDGILTEYHPRMDSIFFKCDDYLLMITKKVVNENIFSQRIYFGKIVTGETFISENGRKQIIDKYDPLCVDMETASVAHVCYVNSIPFLAIRSVTDTESDFGIETFEANCVSASINSIDILKKVLMGIKE